MEEIMKEIQRNLQRAEEGLEEIARISEPLSKMLEEVDQAQMWIEDAVKSFDEVKELLKKETVDDRKAIRNSK